MPGSSCGACPCASADLFAALFSEPPIRAKRVRPRRKERGHLIHTWRFFMTPSQIKYFASEKYRAVKARYQNSKKGKATADRYFTSEKGIAARLKATTNHAQKAKTPRGKWNEYRFAAKARDLEFTLTYEQFLALWQKPCRYCGDPIPTVGIDRLDNSLGYVQGNVVPCCTECNRAKLTKSEYLYFKHCEKVYKHMLNMPLSV